MTKDETVAVGGTVTLTCWVAETDNSSLQWSNTAQQTLYFGEKRGRGGGRGGAQSDIGNAVSGLYEKRHSNCHLRLYSNSNHLPGQKVFCSKQIKTKPEKERILNFLQFVCCKVEHFTVGKLL